MAEANYGIARLAPDDRPGLHALLGIYQQSIEPSEQKSAAEIAAMVGTSGYAVLVLRVADEVRGFTISFFPEGDFWLLEYLAVDGALRSRGFGRILFEAALTDARLRNPGAACVLEVDRPGAVAKPADDVARRFRFYRSLGCRRVDGLDYILPLTENGKPPPMTLLVHGLDGHASMPKPRLAGWLETIYRDVYAQSTDDPRITGMTSPLPADVPLVDL